MTSARAVFKGRTTYAMANVTSVRMFVEPRPLRALVYGIIFALVGGGCANASVASVSTMGVVVLMIGVLLLLWYVLTTPKHWVRIGTAGAESNAISSGDPKWTQAVVAAINQAIVARG